MNIYLDIRRGVVIHTAQIYVTFVGQGHGRKMLRRPQVMTFLVITGPPNGPKFQMRKKA